MTIHCIGLALASSFTESAHTGVRYGPGTGFSLRPPYRRGRIVTSAQAIAVKHHERLAVERQVGSGHSGKTNALCEKRLQESRSLEVFHGILGRDN